MTSEIAVAKNSKNSPLVRLAERYGMEPAALHSTLMQTVMPSDNRTKVTNEMFAAFLLVAENYDLDPMRKQIFAFPHRGGIVPVVGVDGWYSIMNAHPQFDGVEYVDTEDEKGNLTAVTAKIWRKDRGHPISITEYMAECKGTSEPWKKWPRRMLRHKATIQGARAAFGISGVYDEDERDRMKDVVARDTTPGQGGVKGLSARLEPVAGPAMPAAWVQKEMGADMAVPGTESVSVERTVEVVTGSTISPASGGTTDSGGRLKPADAAPVEPAPEQDSFFDEVPVPTEPTFDARECWQAGADAGDAAENPYPAGSQAAWAWDLGVMGEVLPQEKNA